MLILFSCASVYIIFDWHDSCYLLPFQCESRNSSCSYRISGSKLVGTLASRYLYSQLEALVKSITFNPDAYSGSLSAIRHNAGFFKFHKLFLFSTSAISSDIIVDRMQLIHSQNVWVHRPSLGVLCLLWQVDQVKLGKRRPNPLIADSRFVKKSAVRDAKTWGAQ